MRYFQILIIIFSLLFFVLSIKTELPAISLVELRELLKQLFSELSEK